MEERNASQNHFFSGLKNLLVRLSFGLFIVALAMAGMSAKSYLTQRPADAYVDEGIYTFVPKEVYPVQVKSSGVGREKRMNPTRTVYKVYYRTTSSSGYQWSMEAISKSDGQRILKAGEPVERRVLSIAGEGKYITVEPEYTAESYVHKNRERYLMLFSLSAIYLAVFGAACIWNRRKG